MNDSEAYEIGLALLPLIEEQKKQGGEVPASMWDEADWMTGEEGKVPDVRHWRTLPALAHLADYCKARIDNGARIGTHLIDIGIETDWVNRVREFREDSSFYTLWQISQWLRDRADEDVEFSAQLKYLSERVLEERDLV